MSSELTSIVERFKTLSTLVSKNLNPIDRTLKKSAKLSVGSVLCASEQYPNQEIIISDISKKKPFHNPFHRKGYRIKKYSNNIF